MLNGGNKISDPCKARLRLRSAVRSAHSEARSQPDEETTNEGGKRTHRRAFDPDVDDEKSPVWSLTTLPSLCFERHGSVQREEGTI